MPGYPFGMKVAQISNERLVIVDRPWTMVIACWVLGASAIYAAVFDADSGAGHRLFLGILGLGTMWVAGRLMPFVTLDFDRTAGTATRRYHRVTGTESEVYPLTEVVGARAVSSWIDGSRMERLALVTPGGQIPVEIGFVGVPRGTVAAEITEWLEAGAARF